MWTLIDLGCLQDPSSCLSWKPISIIILCCCTPQPIMCFCALGPSLCLFGCGTGATLVADTDVHRVHRRDPSMLLVRVCMTQLRQFVGCHCSCALHRPVQTQSSLPVEIEGWRSVND